MKVERFSLVLTGHFAGKTVKLNDYQFEDGVLQLVDTRENVEGLITYFGKSYCAFLEGSDELKRVREATDGKHNLQGQGSEAGQDPIDGDLQPGGEGPATVSSVNGTGHAETQEGPEGRVPSGDGYTDTRVYELKAPVAEIQAGEENLAKGRLLNAVRALDTENDNHWTKGGLPRLEAIETALKSTDVAREDVVAVAPGLDRETARAKALEALT